MENSRTFYPEFDDSNYLMFVDIERSVTPFYYSVIGYDKQFRTFLNTDANCLSEIIEFDWGTDPYKIPKIISKLATVSLAWNCKIELQYVDDERLRHPTKMKLFIFSDSEDNAIILKMML